MFDKYKARLKKFEEDHESVHKVIQHVEKNKNTYLVGAGCFVVGAAGMKMTNLASTPDVIQTFTDSKNNIGTVVNRSKNVDVVIQYLNQRNYAANPVRCLETGIKYASQTEAAEAFRMDSSIMSRHLNGIFENALGYHFERI